MSLIVVWITCEGIHAVKTFSLHLNSLSKKIRSWSHLEMRSAWACCFPPCGLCTQRQQYGVREKLPNRKSSGSTKCLY